MLLRTILNSFYYSGVQSVCAPVTQGIGSILMLHHVRNEADADFSPNAHLSVSPEFLDAAILRLKLSGYEFVSMDEMADIIHQDTPRKSGKPAIAVTLDDGYRDNLHNAVPVFKRHGVPYTIYIAPGLVDGNHTLWWEDLEAVIAGRKRIAVEFLDGVKNYDTETAAQKSAAFKELLDLMTTVTSEEDQREIINRLCRNYNHDAKKHVAAQIMDWNELKTLSKDELCTLGAHTMGHYALARLPDERALFEMRESRDVLEKKLKQPVSHFAYPYGYQAATGRREFEIAQKLGFRTAVTTRHGVVYPEHGEHLTALPRISLNGSYQSMRYVHTLLSGVTTRMNNKGRKLNVA